MQDAAFDITLLDYDLPADRIAQRPLDRRDSAKLLVLDRSSGRMFDRTVADLPKLLNPGDLMVLNDTRVIPAKFTAYRKTGGKIGGLFVRETNPRTWEVMLEGARRCRIGESLCLQRHDQPDIALELLEKKGAGHWIVRPKSHEATEHILNRVGQTPLPPYIHRESNDEQIDLADRTRYQTVFARIPGAVAAPTAGLHFTAGLLDRIQRRGIEIAYVTLHVGLATFKPICADNLAEHVMHEERYELSAATADAVRACRERGDKVVAVGTTAVRTLESCAEGGSASSRAVVRPKSGTTRLFIYPPRKLHVVDAMLTNFHLPRSTLLALVMATAGVTRTQDAYRHAVKSHYRFFSYGDAMLIV